MNKEVFKRKVALTIRQLREEKGVAQDIVWFDEGIHIARLESGKIDPRISTIARLCDYFEITISEFFEKVESL